MAVEDSLGNWLIPNLLTLAGDLHRRVREGEHYSVYCRKVNAELDRRRNAGPSNANVPVRGRFALVGAGVFGIWPTRLDCEEQAAAMGLYIMEPTRFDGHFTHAVIMEIPEE